MRVVGLRFPRVWGGCLDVSPEAGGCGVFLLCFVVVADGCSGFWLVVRGVCVGCAVLLLVRLQCFLTADERFGFA